MAGLRRALSRLRHLDLVAFARIWTAVMAVGTAVACPLVLFDHANAAAWVLGGSAAASLSWIIPLARESSRSSS